MEPELLHYEKIVEDALRSVVGTALQQVATFGLPEGHGLYITFLTAGRGVVIPERLAKTYPEEMTIVLEHQFWNLEVGKELFSVELSFNRRQEKLEIPFDCVTSFADPSVPFGLKFELTDSAETPQDEAAAEADDSPPAASNEETVGDEAEDGAPQSGEVVNLDSFRKKR